LVWLVGGGGGGGVWGGGGGGGGEGRGALPVLMRRNYCDMARMLPRMLTRLLTLSQAVARRNVRMQASTDRVPCGELGRPRIAVRSHNSLFFEFTCFGKEGYYYIYTLLLYIEEKGIFLFFFHNSL
jgi:hypothetical protein